MSPSKKSREPGVHAHLQALGLRTLNESTLLTRPSFASKAVNQLYRLEIGALFGLMCRDSFDRDDPNLFDTELHNLLCEYGPLIWPKPGHGDRQYLRDDSDLEYPRDTTVLKNGLRALILSKRLEPETDLDALINKRHGDGPSTQATPRRRQPPSHSSEYTDGAVSSDSEDSVFGTVTRRRARSRSSFTTIELRLYRRMIGGSGATSALGSLLLPLGCPKSDDCFDLIREKFAIKCRALVFELPADMSNLDYVHMERNSDAGEAAFQEVLEIFRNAKKYPGDPQYHSVEVRVEL